MIWQSIGLFTGIAMILVGIDGYLGFFKNKLAFELRTNLVNHFLAQPDKADHPQQIQEDTRYYSDTAVEFYSTVLMAGIKLPIFAYIVASLTSWWVACILVVVAVAGTYLVRRVDTHQIQLQTIQESDEAAFRQQLMRGFNYNRGFGVITQYFNHINREVKKLAFLQSALMQGFVLLPFILLMPLYVSKALTLGGFMQTVNGLAKVVDSLTILIDNRQLIVKLDTAKIRLLQIL